MQEKMTVHQALSELKVLDARIEDELRKTTFVVANKHTNDNIGGMTVKEYAASVKSKWQSITDLYKRMEAIKKAVVLSNAVTKVIIDGVEYTVAEAIEMKNRRIPILKSMIAKLSSDLMSAERTCQNMNGEALENKADTYISTVYGVSDNKKFTDQILEARTKYIEQQKYDVVDALGTPDTVQKLRDKVDAFMVSVDSALSVSNAVTILDVEY